MNIENNKKLIQEDEKQIPTLSQVEDVLKKSKYFKVSKEPTDIGFILPDGLFVNVSHDGWSGWHIDVENYLYDNDLADAAYVDKVWGEDAETGNGAPSLEKFGAMRINSIEQYICLPPIQPTEETYKSLLAWLDYYFAGSYRNWKLSVTNYKGDDYKSYKVSETTTDTIIKNIKRYYTTGKLVEDVINEGTHYDDEAVKILDTANIYSHEINQKIINLLYRGDEQNEPDIHAFVHAPNWLMKYLKGIARMLVQYSNKNQDKAKEFLEQASSVFEPLLTWIKTNRTEKNATELDDNFVNKWSFEDTKDFLAKIQAEEEKQSADKLKDIKSTSSSYDLIPIDSYNQFHNTFGGKWTGDGGNDKGAGMGGTAWCHANGQDTYNGWVENNTYKFFVLAKKNWKDISAIEGDNCPKDEYGLSLMALRVKVLDGSLMNCTLRWNHIHVSSNADNQFTNYGDLSQAAGFNVKEQINERLKDIQLNLQKEIEGINKKVENLLQGLEKITPNTISRKIKNEITSIIIPNSITKIGGCAFWNCTSLTSITIPNSVKEIEDDAFNSCKSLASIIIPNSVKEIGYYAFGGCTSLEIIYCEAPSQPEGWDGDWLRGCNAEVIWGYKRGGANESYITEVYPHKGESKQDFITRFMKATEKEYDNPKQRLAVAYSYWDNYKESLNMTESKKIEEEYTIDNFIDKVFEENVNSDYQETIEAMVDAIDEIKDDSNNDELISNAASEIADMFGASISRVYDDLIEDQEKKLAGTRRHHYPDADDLEGTYNGPLDERLISKGGNKWDSEGNFVITKSGKKISKGDKDKDGDYVTGFDPDSNSIYIDSDPDTDGGSDYDINEYEDEIVSKIKESEESQRATKDELEKMGTLEDKETGIILAHAAHDLKQYPMDPVFGNENAVRLLMSKYKLTHQQVIRYLNYVFDGKVVEEDFKDRQKSIRCLKDLGKNYNFDRFSDQQLYVMCKKAQREAQQLAQERAEMEDELENCPEAQTCPQCGGPLNDAGECPKCDLGDENESLKAEDTKKYNYKSDEVDDMLYALAARNDLYKVEVECNGNSVTLNDLYTLGKAVVAAKEEIVDEINNIGWDNIKEIRPKFKKMKIEDDLISIPVTIRAYDEDGFTYENDYENSYTINLWVESKSSEKNETDEGLKEKENIIKNHNYKFVLTQTVNDFTFINYETLLDTIIVPSNYDIKYFKEKLFATEFVPQSFISLLNEVSKENKIFIHNWKIMSRSDYRITLVGFDSRNEEDTYQLAIYDYDGINSNCDRVNDKSTLEKSREVYEDFYGSKIVNVPSMSLQEMKDYCDAWQVDVLNTGVKGKYKLEGQDVDEVVDELKADGYIE